jgi:protein phosphatase 1 regulatory subunit 7
MLMKVCKFSYDYSGGTITILCYLYISTYYAIHFTHTNNSYPPDLLDDYPLDTTEIDLVHARISSIPSLKLSRFTSVIRLCLRQNSITQIEDLSSLSSTLQDLDLYDNLISHIRGLDDLVNLTSLDLSFNKLKHIKKISHLTNLTDLYFVQNKITTIENLSGLTKLRNLELAANRIREIQGLDDLVNLEELWLGKNKITSISNLAPLRSLKILSIQSNRIRALENLTLPTLHLAQRTHLSLRARLRPQVAGA